MMNTITIFTSVERVSYNRTVEFATLNHTSGNQKHLVPSPHLWPPHPCFLQEHMLPCITFSGALVTTCVLQTTRKWINTKTRSLFATQNNLGPLSSMTHISHIAFGIPLAVHITLSYENTPTIQHNNTHNGLQAVWITNTGEHTTIYNVKHVKYVKYVKKHTSLAKFGITWKLVILE